MCLHAGESAIPSAGRGGREVDGQVLKATVTVVPERVVVAQVETVIAVITKSTKLLDSCRRSKEQR